MRPGPWPVSSGSSAWISGGTDPHHRAIAAPAGNLPQQITARPQPNSSRTVQTAMIMAATSAVSPAGTAWRVFLMFTAPKYTAIT
jgi:hypothetical protein